LFRNFSERFEIHVKRVIIQKLVDGVFYSSLICERDQIEEIIDSRTSDAISLALRFNAPIFAHESVLEKAAVMIDDKDLDKDSEDNSKNIDDLQQLSVNELEKLIQKALKKEEYELAVKIRDEIAKRESKP
jgi:bifunctional DNase/RNase